MQTSKFSQCPKVQEVQMFLFLDGSFPKITPAVLNFRNFRELAQALRSPEEDVLVVLKNLNKEPVSSEEGTLVALKSCVT